MSTPNVSSSLNEKQRADAVLFLAGGISLAGIAKGCGCTLAQLWQEMRQNADFRWQMDNAREIIAAQMFLYIARAAATEPAAAKSLQKHLHGFVPSCNFLLALLAPGSPTSGLPTAQKSQPSEPNAPHSAPEIPPKNLDRPTE